MKNLSIVFIIAGFVVGFGAFLLSGGKKDDVTALGGTPGNLPAQIASSTRIILAAKATVRAFSTSTPQSRSTCASRVISSYGDSLVITLDDPRENLYRNNIGSTTLSYMVGHQLASSTLHVLDSANYGCGDIYIHAPNSSTTVTVTEFR